MERSLKKLENDLKEARKERDKAVQQLNRLKQHLLEKVVIMFYFRLFIICAIHFGARVIRHLVCDDVFAIMNISLHVFCYSFGYQ